MTRFKTSLAEWMIENLGEDSIEKYWSDKNEINPWEIGYGSNKTILMKRQDTYSQEDYETTPKGFRKNIEYRQGKIKISYKRKTHKRKVHPNNSLAQWGIDNLGEDFIEKYWSSKNTLSPWEISRGSRKMIWVNCVEKDYHEPYPTVTSRFSGKQGSRCPYCSNWHGKVHPRDSLGELYQEAVSLWSDLNEKSPFEYAPKTEQSVYWKCENVEHDDYKRSIKSSNNYNFRCPKCVKERNESFLQEKVRLFLTNELGYKVNHEHSTVLKCISPKTNMPLPYDNELLINEKAKLIIEVHGNQHYRKESLFNKISARNNNTTPQKELEYIQRKDKFKMECAISQGYHYLVIPYWTADNGSEKWKTLIINKLNEMFSG